MRTVVNCAALTCLSTAALELVERRYLAAALLFITSAGCFRARRHFPLPGRERER
jgi:hypothetical protein